MPLTGLFKSTFYDLLIPRGFKYKSNLFYRINGDGIFQMISIWNRRFYEINAVNYPIWALEDVIHMSEESFDARISRTDIQMMVREGLKRGDVIGRELLPNNPDYERNDESPTIENLRTAEEILRTALLPSFDRTVDFSSYLKWRTGWYRGAESIRGLEKVTPFELCVKAYTDGTSEEASELLEKLLERITERDIDLYVDGLGVAAKFQSLIAPYANSSDEAKKMYSNLLTQVNVKNNAELIEKEKKKIAADVQNKRNTYFRPFVASVEKNDFSWVGKEMARRELYGKKIIGVALGAKALESIYNSLDR